MTQDEIKELAGHRDVSPWIIKLVGDAVAKEREACALKAEDFLTEPEPDWDGDFWNQAIERVAMAIRARGEK